MAKEAPTTINKLEWAVSQAYVHGNVTVVSSHY
jgi:hypothetical protein